MHKTIYFLKRLGVLHNISISFQPYDERRSCNVVETEFLANYTVFVSLAHMLSVIPKRDGETPKGNMSIDFLMDAKKPQRVIDQICGKSPTVQHCSAQGSAYNSILVPGCQSSFHSIGFTCSYLTCVSFLCSVCSGTFAAYNPF